MISNLHFYQHVSLYSLETTNISYRNIFRLFWEADCLKAEYTLVELDQFHLGWVNGLGGWGGQGF